MTALLRPRTLLLCALLLCLFAGTAVAQAAQQAVQQAAPAAPAAAPALPSLPPVTVGQVGNQPVSMPMQVLLLMTSITLLPALLLGVTAFTRIIIVLSLLRQALGTGQAPSNQVLLALALFLVQVLLAHAWLARFRFGPVEWLWRSLTYLKPQPMRLAPL